MSKNLGIFIPAIVAIVSPCAATAGNQLQSSAADEQAEDGQYDTLVVTGSKTDTQLSKLPASATVFNEVALDRARIDTIGDLERHVPNLTIGRLGQVGENYISIRGISSSASGVNRTAVYIDDVPYREIGNQALFDVEQVEVLRGPQGVLYGANTEAGVIVIRTRQPSDEFTASVNLGAEAFEGGEKVSIGASVSGPLTDKVRGLVSAHASGEDSLVSNLGPSRSGDEKIDQVSLRSVIEADLTPNLTAKLQFSMLNVDAPGVFDEEILPIDIALYNSLYANSLNGGVVAGEYNVVQDVKKYYDEDEYVGALNIKYEGSWAEVISISSYRWEKLRGIGAEADLTAAPIFNSGKDDRKEDFYQELRVSSQQDTPFDWLIGLSYLKGDRELSIATQAIALGQTEPIFGSPQSEGAEDYAAFANVRIPLVTNHLHFSFGARYERSERTLDTESQVFSVPGLGEFEFPGISASRDFEIFLPRFAIEYELNGNTMVYANAARGWQPGGFNVDAFSTDFEEDFSSYDSEKLWTYEVGAKGGALQGDLTWQIAAFYTEADNWQEPNFILSDDGTAASTSIIRSTSEITAFGFEVEALWRPITALSVAGGLGYTDGEYGRYVFSQTQDFSENETILTPRYTASLSADYEADSGWFGHIDLSTQAPMQLDAANTLEQKAYSLVGLSAGWRGEHYTISAYGDNLTNEYYFTGQGFNNPAFGDDGVGYAAVGEPRRFGIRLSGRM